jgi:hypothetical protein
MRKSKSYLAAAVMGLGLTSGALANPIVDMNLVIRDLSTANANTGNVIAPTTVIGGVAHYTITQGTAFRVELDPTIRAGTQYSTDANHSGGGVINLGIQALSASITAGGSNITSAISATGANAGKWGRDNPASATVAARIAPVNGFMPASFTASDTGSDGDLDVTGIGYAVNIVPSWDDSQNLQGMSLGLATPQSSDSQGPTVNATRMIAGAWNAVNAGASTLSVGVSTLNAWFDPAVADDSLQAVPLGDSSGNAATFAAPGVVIDVVAAPEPASLGLLGLGAIGLIRRRRQA